jgi:hypothetical protein
MKVLIAAAVIAIAFLAVPAQAQMGGGGGGHKHQKQDQNAQPKKKVDESEYKAALKKIPDQPKSDPWGGVRQSAAGSKN